MIRDAFLVCVYLSFLVLGCTAPFIFTLGYLWVDTFRPQEVSWGLLSQLPVSLIMAAAALGGYALLETRKSPLPITAQTVLTLIFAVWVTFTTLIALVPEAAWPKWDWAFKTLVFSAFIPFVISSRLRIEAFLQVYIFALAIHYVAAGGKTLLGGGGYGRTLSAAGNSNFGLAEGSTLAAVSVMIVPLIIYLMRHTIIMPRLAVIRLGYLGLIVFALACAVGTYARTGLIGMIVLAAALWLTTRRKFLVGGIIALAAVTILAASSATWNERISTIDDYKTEGSALGRILVWKWTLGFVQTHPLGGGFNSYIVNEVTFPPAKEGDPPITVYGKAFHSIYFEVLGEQGLPGMAIFLALIGYTLLSLLNALRRTRGNEEMLWCFDLAKALLTSFIVLLACGSFIGIAFQPMLYFMFALSASVSAQVARATALQRAPGLVAMRRSGAIATTPSPALPVWRR